MCRFLVVLGWNLLFLVIVIIAAEAVFGSWFRGGGLGSLHLPRNVDLRHDVSEKRTNRQIAVYRRDQWGFRGQFGKPSEIDILAVGGSTTNELYHDEMETWTAVLEERFRQNGKQVTVANAGVDGHSSVGHLVSLESWFPRIPDLKPRVVLYYVGINDTLVEHHARYDRIVPDDQWERFRRYASNNSALNSLFRTVRGALKAQRTRVVYGSEPPNIRALSAVEAATALAQVRHQDYLPRLDAYAGRIREIVMKTRAMGARVVLSTQRRGDAFFIDGTWQATGPSGVSQSAVQDLFNLRLLDVCRELNARCLPLAREIDLKPDDFEDPVHLNPGGSRKVGDYLYRQLRTMFEN